jgi:hypothetical protein
MLLSRRSVFRFLSFAGICTAFEWFGRAQEPFPPTRQNPVRPGEDDPNLPPKSSGKAVLEENQKDIKKNVERLFELASQLKAQVERTDATTTLSLAMLKKAEEIEKLARQIKERAKG